MSQPTTSAGAALLGCLTYLLTLAFGIGLSLVLTAATWFDLDAGRGWFGFFAFGIAMLLAGAGTAALWDNAPPLAWTAVLYGVANGIVVLVLLANLLLSPLPPADPGWQAKTTEPSEVKEHEKARAAYTTAKARYDEHRTVQITCLLGFVACMLVSGGVGIGMLKGST